MTIFIKIGVKTTLKLRDLPRSTTIESLVERIHDRGYAAVNGLVFQARTLRWTDTIEACGIQNKQSLSATEPDVVENVDYWHLCGLNKQVTRRKFLNVP